MGWPLGGGAVVVVVILVIVIVGRRAALGPEVGGLGGQKLCGQVARGGGVVVIAGAALA